MASSAGDRNFMSELQELRELVVAYARQETVEPIKGLGRFVAFGVAGSIVLGIGLILLLLGGLRALQTQTGSTFTGKLSWAPYLIDLVGTGILIALTVSAVGRGQSRKKKKKT